jgi:hypothetical protein
MTRIAHAKSYQSYNVLPVYYKNSMALVGVLSKLQPSAQRSFMHAFFHLGNSITCHDLLVSEGRERQRC